MDESILERELPEDPNYVPQTQFELIKDIFASDELLILLNRVIAWLTTTGKIDQGNIFQPTNFTLTKQSERNLSLEPDEIYQDGSKMDHRTRYEHIKLMKHVLE